MNIKERVKEYIDTMSLMDIKETVREYLDTMSLMDKQVPFEIVIKGKRVIAKKSSRDTTNYRQDIVLPDFITELDKGIFDGMSKVKKITLPASLRVIGGAGITWVCLLRGHNHS